MVGQEETKEDLSALVARVRAGDDGALTKLLRAASADDEEAIAHLFLLACEDHTGALEGMVDLALGGDSPEAKARLVEYARRFFRGFAAQLHLDPEDHPSDLAQSCAARLIEHLESVRERSAVPFLEYLRQIARRWQIDKIRRRMRHREVQLDEDTAGVAGGGLPSAEAPHPDGFDDDLERRLTQLSATDRELVVKKYVEERTYGEIGAGFDPPWSEDKVRMRITRALRRLGGEGPARAGDR